MGTWGHKTFENDGAADLRDSVVASWTARVEEIISSESEIDLDDAGESELVPLVEMISVFCKHLLAAPPPLEDVRRWRAKYLHVFDDQIDDLDPEPGFKPARRKAIEATFNLLIHQSEVYHT